MWHHPQQPQSVWLYSRMCHAENDVTATDGEYRKFSPLKVNNDLYHCGTCLRIPLITTTQTPSCRDTLLTF